MKTLDALLYRWVGESDESRVETAFRAYYSTAFPSLVRHVRHRTGWDSASAEDIAQDALLRFFERVGRGRRQAIVLLRSAAAQLTSPEPGAVHTPRTTHWATDVIAFADSVINLHLTPGNPILDDRLRSVAGECSARIEALQRCGWRLLEETIRQLPACPDGCGAKDAESFEQFLAAAGDGGSAEFAEDERVRFAKRLAHAASLGASGQIRAEECRPGLARFVDAALMIIETLPRVRVPTNGYLFEIATTTLLDEIKKRRTKKRGGPPGAATECPPGIWGARYWAPHPLEAVSDEPRALPEEMACSAGQPPAERRPLPGSETASRVDPVVRYESEEFLNRFYEYLRSPVARAADALEQARARGRSLAQQRRFDSVSRKFSRTMAVLCMIAEGYTQQQTAEQVGLSRNQVKYIVENVKEAYMRFAADDGRGPHPRIKRTGEPHVS